MAAQNTRSPRGAHDDADFEYTWDGFAGVRASYDRVATIGPAAIFTAA